MKLLNFISTLLLLSGVEAFIHPSREQAYISLAKDLEARKAAGPRAPGRQDGHIGVIKPKFMILSVFSPEAVVWYNNPHFNLLALNITVPGFSPLLPDAHCTLDLQICQVVMGEGEINAAATMTALTTSVFFDLSSTYFMIAGIAGVNPECGTLGTVAFAKYGIQVGLAYEIDARELTSNLSTGYIPFGSDAPHKYPMIQYGSEGFELNENLQKIAIAAASKAVLEDSPEAIKYRSKYPNASANQPAKVIAGDVATGDVYFHGKLLAETMGDYVSLLSNGSAKYCMTGQEDNAIFEPMIRAHLFGLMDFSRVILMRTGAAFDRPPPGISATQELFYIDQGGYLQSEKNIYLAGINVVQEIVGHWEKYKNGVTPSNYVGDILRSIPSVVAADIGSDYAVQA